MANIVTQDNTRYTSPLDDRLTSSLSLHHWISSAPTGAYRVLPNGEMYVMTSFGHRTVDKTIAKTLLQRERVMLAEINRRRDVCAALWRCVAYCLTALTTAAYIA